MLIADLFLQHLWQIRNAVQFLTIIIIIIIQNKTILACKWQEHITYNIWLCCQIWVLSCQWEPNRDNIDFLPNRPTESRSWSGNAALIATFLVMCKIIKKRKTPDKYISVQNLNTFLVQLTAVLYCLLIPERFVCQKSEWIQLNVTSLNIYRTCEGLSLNNYCFFS